MPTIGLNLLYLVPGETGGSETYARGLVPALAREWPEARWIVLASREAAADWRSRPWTDSATLVELPVWGRTRVRRIALEQSLVPWAVARHGIDLLHSLATTQPALVPGARSVVTIHDLIYKRFPETHGGLLAYGMGALVPMAARAADRVIAISDATRADLMGYLSVPETKIDVVPEGPGREPTVEPTPEHVLRRRLGLGSAPIVLSPSARRAHKNLTRLIEAVAEVADAMLVLPGYADHIDDQLHDLIARHGLTERVRMTGWLSDADLEGLYCASTCLCFPSLAEGFGLPVLEAMRRGLPVACSDCTSLPEVAGDAALLFDPYSVRDIAQAMSRLLGDARLRDTLRRLGRVRAARFTWERAAAGTIVSYRRALRARSAWDR